MKLSGFEAGRFGPFAETAVAPQERIKDANDSASRIGDSISLAPRLPKPADSPIDSTEMFSRVRVQVQTSKSVPFGFSALSVMGGHGSCLAPAADGANPVPSSAVRFAGWDRAGDV